MEADPNQKSPLLLLLASASLALAILTNNGLFSPLAICFLGMAVVCFILSRVWPVSVGVSRLNHILIGIILLNITCLLLSRPLNDHPAPAALSDYLAAWPYYTFCLIAPISALFFRRMALPLTLISFLSLGIWIIHANPSPNVDVFTYQRDASIALFQLHNPYTITFPNPYGEAGLWTFAPGAATPERILFGFPYMPLSLLAVAPTQALMEDYRYAHLLYVLITAISLTGLGRFSRTSCLIALIFLTFPRLPWVIEWGWTEPLLALLLVWSLRGGERGNLPAWLLLSAKQYMPLLLPVGWVQSPRRLLLPIAVACVLTLPLVLWDFHAFWSSAIALQFHQPFRPDALSLPALLHYFDLPIPPAWLPLPAAFLAALLLRWRLGGSARSRALIYATALLLLFGLSKQAFANYYFLLLTSWLALLVIETNPADAENPPSRNLDSSRTIAACPIPTSSSLEPAQLASPRPETSPPGE